LILSHVRAPNEGRPAIDPGHLDAGPAAHEARVYSVTNRLACVRVSCSCGEWSSTYPEGTSLPVIEVAHAGHVATQTDPGPVSPLGLLSAIREIRARLVTVGGEA